MSTVKLRNINPLGHVDLPIAARQGEPLGEEGVGCLEPGEVFEIPADIAGRPPKLNADRTGYAVDDDGAPVDVGEGLLAQWSNYELVTAAKRPRRRSTTKKSAAAKATVPSPTPTPAPVAANTVTEV